MDLQDYQRQASKVTKKGAPRQGYWHLAWRAFFPATAQRRRLPDGPNAPNKEAIQTTQINNPMNKTTDPNAEVCRLIRRDIPK